MKTKGSVDKVRSRKRRSDKGRKRDRYAGKKTKPRVFKSGKYVGHVSTRRENDPIKLYFWDIQKMKTDSLHHWNKKIRRKVKRIVYGKNRLRVDAYPEDINTKQKLADVCQDLLWDGKWLLLIFGHARNTHHVAPRGFAVITIKDTSKGLVTKVTPHFNRRYLSRLWWWKDK